MGEKKPLAQFGVIQGGQEKGVKAKKNLNLRHQEKKEKETLRLHVEKGGGVRTS